MMLPESLSAILPRGAALRLPDRPVRVLGIDLGTTNSTPRSAELKPDRDLLERRYERFLKAG